MKRQPTTPGADDGLAAGESLNAIMHTFVDGLGQVDHGVDGTTDPLRRKLSLVTLWRRLCPLAGESIPWELETYRASGLPLPRIAGGPLSSLLSDFLAELRAEGVALAEHHPLPVGLVCADLCRITGEEPPATVQALLDEPACAV